MTPSLLPKRASSKLHVLVVDDTELNRRLLEAMLRKMGHEVILSSGGEQALQIFAADPPDLVLLDVSMPVMDGFEVAKQIRLKNVWVPIFFVSANTSNEDVVKGLHSGGDDYLFKPVNYEILQSKIRTFQERLGMSERLLRKNQILLDYRARIEDETDTAREFIKQFTALDKIDDELVRFLLKPAENFSGDLIAVARTPDDRLHVLLADSAGHGLTAALAVIPITQPFYQMTAKGFEIPAIIREINRRVRDYLPLPRFVAAVMVSLDASEQNLQVWNGGCPPALLLNDDGSEVLHRFVSNHLPLGVVSPEQFDTTLEYYSYADQPARLLLCSDGATEMSVSEGNNLGYAGLLEGSRQAGSDHLFDRMVEVIEGYLPEEGPEDDIALILLECPLDKESVAVPEFVQMPTHIPVNSATQCDFGKNGQHLWELAVTLTAEQLRRMDVVPFLISITGQVNGGNPGGKVFLVLSELFNNALDHGVLKLDSHLKNGSEGMERYFEERALRLAELKQGQIFIGVQRQACSNCTCLKITFKDSGPGFDYSASRGENLAGNKQRHGRGISLLASICNELRYSGNGSEVLACLDDIN